MASITQRGTGWLAQVRIKQGGAIVFSESKTFTTEAMARSWAERLEAKVRREGAPAAAVGRLTLGELIIRHLQYQRTLRPLGRSTIANHEYMAQEFARLQLAELRARHLVDWAVKRRGTGVTPATVLANLAAVSAAVHAAPYAHGIQVDPAEVDLAMAKLREDGVTAKSREVVRIVTEAEERALLEQFERRNAHHQTSIDMALMYRVAIALPRRVSELCRMRWADLDPRRRTITIRDVKHPKRKLGNDQVVPLLGEAWTLLEQAPKLEERVFPHLPESVCAAFERTRNVIAATGMPAIADLRFHDLRHTGITRLFQRGLSIQQVAMVSGHTNWTQLRRYTHLQPEDVHKAFDAPTRASA